MVRNGRSGRSIIPAISRGRRRVTLSDGGRKWQVYVHQLVLLAFVGPAPPGQECCHRDGDPSNNALANLRWGTRLCNACDRRLHGRQFRGETHPLAKLTEGAVAEIRRRLLAGERKADLAREYGTTRQNIRTIERGDTWSHLSSTEEPCEAR
jgi:hypothetical protein